MYIDAARLANFAKHGALAVKRRAGSAPPAKTRHQRWEGPPNQRASDELSPTLSLTPVGDIVLIQGVASPAAELILELGDGQTVADSQEISHRFPHPLARIEQADRRSGFEISMDAEQLGSATHVRVRAADQISQWHPLGEVSRPSAIPGVEVIAVCPACGESASRHTGRQQHLDMVTCLGCGLVRTDPRPSEDHTLLRYSETYFTEEYLPSAQPSIDHDAHVDQLLDRVEQSKQYSSTLFELGVGGGGLLERARTRGWSVAGTDVNPAAVSYSKQRGLRVWDENSDHAENLGGTYGAIVSDMSLEHLRRPEHFGQLAANALVPGGVLLLYTVSAEGESFEHAGMGSPLVGPAEHLFLFSAQSLVELCARAGLRTDMVWRSSTGDEIGIVASKRLDAGNPAIR